MEPNPTVPALASELARAVELIMNPTTSPEARKEAYEACESFKDASPLCAQAGLFLASGHQFSTSVKHFGLQLMEHTVKFKWNTISHQEKIFIKESSMQLLLTGVGPAEDISLAPLKDALSRIIVEMIKREWPQQWTTLLAELSDACARGEAQTELVLLIFLRLVEDVALLQTIESNQRRKDIYQALTLKMDEIFDFFLRLIEMHVNGFRSTTTIGNLQKARAHSRVVQVVLLTLTGFVEWVSITHIMRGEGKLLQILCILLNDIAFQNAAAECLSQIVNRKGQVKDRKPLLYLFGEEPIEYIYRAVVMVPTGAVSIEHNYAFLKKILPVLNGLSQQLTALWGKEEGTIGRPVHFTKYLEAVYILTRHPSLTLSHGAALIWNMLLKHEHISRDALFLEYIPKVIQSIGPKVIKIPYPTSRPVTIGMDTESYISIDYDSEEEFTIFFHRCRTDFLEIFRQATLIVPLVTFAYCENWLNLRLSKAHSETYTTCSIHDPVYMEWEALVAVLDGVLSRILMVSERPSVTAGIRLLEECIKIETSDPLVLSVILSCISALFVFLSMSSCQIPAGNNAAMTAATLMRVLSKIFASLVFTENSESKSPRSKAVKNLRRHAASLMVKLGHKYPLLLLPVFDQIHVTVKNLIQSQQITKMEAVTLQEALLLISNHFCDYIRQTSFVKEIIDSAQSQWTELAPIFRSPPDFINYIGLNKAPIMPLESDPCAPNRGKIIDALHIVLGVVKRCSWPDDPDRASRGGFVVGRTESYNPVYRNPATPHVLPLLPNIFALLRVLNELFSVEALAMLSEGYKNVHAMLEHEKKVLMGVSPVLTDPMDPTIKKVPTALDKMQQFLTLIFDGCYHMMGASGPSLGRDLYQWPTLVSDLIGSSFSSLEHVPDYRLRSIIRVFLKPFVYSCPSAFYEQVLVPVFAHLAPIMLHRLKARWEYITALYAAGKLNEEDDTQEVLDDMLNRTLTREYLDVLKVALVGGSITMNDHLVGNASDATMDFEDQSMDGMVQSMTRATQSAMASEVISDLGGKLLRNQATCHPIVLTILHSIFWNDGQSSLKAVQLAGPIIRFLTAEQLLTEWLATNTMASVLRALQIHGQHESNQASLITLGVQVYEITRPKFPTIIAVMQQIPSINLADLQQLDEKIALGQTKGNKIDKAKKDLFKKITAQLIGCSMNQLFRQEIEIANLPPMNLPSRNLQRATDILTNNGQSVGLTELFNPS
ncbi:unnamed protein product [Hermetia illucens]|uniref:Exportin-5 n=2 Tax=Hermetia illucens TaxID=343691 RepID=A0A7R8UUZ4_HERIL|nr:unnamed protein product [Hermetia illucens]